MKKLFITASAEQTEAVGKRLASALDEAGIKDAFIAMEGEMGVGKTVFVRGFASHFGVTTVKSPTYTVLNEYPGRCKIHHFDLYRIEDEDDLFSIGYEDSLAAGGYSVAEWSERVPEALPDDRITVNIKKTDYSEKTDERAVEILSDVFDLPI